MTPERIDELVAEAWARALPAAPGAAFTISVRDFAARVAKAAVREALKEAVAACRKVRIYKIVPHDEAALTEAGIVGLLVNAEIAERYVEAILGLNRDDLPAKLDVPVVVLGDELRPEQPAAFE
jgi:hypothetical protein